jgi:uncharacterized protein YggT (Ycf19 family)
MSALDLVLNLTALLLWLNWWGRGWGAPRAGIALVSTLRRAEPSRRDRWRSPAMLASILLLRAIAYWQIGSSIKWTPQLSLVAIVVPFRSDSLPRMLLFSVLSLLVFMGGFYICLLLVSAANRSVAAHDPWQSFVRALLGPFDRLPGGAKLLLPFVLGGSFWMACGPLLSWIGVQVPVLSWAHRIEEAALIGIASWVAWKYVIAAVLVLHVVTTYVYLGNAPFWQFVGNTGSNLVRPLAWLPLRFGRFDFAPVVAVTVVFAATEALRHWLPSAYAHLPL